MADELQADTDYIPDEALFESIDDYLIAIADGLRVAQQRLNAFQVAGMPGQPAMLYHLPKLDFELKMAFKLSQSRATSASEGIEVLSSKKLTIRPILPGSGTADFVAEGASIIRGSFVATPAYGGRPVPELRVALSRPPGTRAGQLVPYIDIVVLLTNSAGELLKGVAVGFDIDRDRLETLNEQLRGPTALLSGTHLSDAIRYTDASGLATVRLNIADSETIGKSIPVVIEALGRTEMLIYRVELGATSNG